MDKNIDDIDNIDPDSVLNEEVEFRDLFTIDPFYGISQYNEALQALENNGIEYDEWISTKPPFNFFINLRGKLPLMMNYDKPTRTDWVKMVSKVKALISTDEVLLHRRGDKQTAVRQYINNDVFNLALKADTTVVFRYKNKDHMAQLSKSYGRMYPIGKYINGSEKLAICFDSKIQNVIYGDALKLVMGKHKLGELESKINYQVLKNRDKITKWTKTPYWLKGVFHNTRPPSPLKI